MRVDTDAILHLHGWFKEPESVVLGLSSYLAVKDHPHAKAVLNLFTIDRTLLFVGCGDTVLDPNFTQLIEWAKEALSDVAPRHYLLCRISEVADFQKKLDGRHVMVNVVSPIWHLTQPCPVCGQGSALVLVACPQCEHVAAQCAEEGSWFADARRIEANSQGDSPSLLCPACHTVPLEKFVTASSEQIQAAGLSRSTYA